MMEVEEAGQRPQKPFKSADESSVGRWMEVQEDEELRRQLQPPNSNSVGETNSDRDSIFSDSGDNMSDVEYLQAANKRISEEQYKLSYDDRNLINEEIHGVACNAQSETPELLQSSLAHLSVELKNLVLADGRNNATISSLSGGYLLSRRHTSTNSYVNEPGFRLRFLRTENFNAKKAAIRLMKFMNLMLEVFGAFALFRPIVLTDFKRNEVKILQTGWLQILPFRDRSGRKVFIWVGDAGLSYDPVLRMKITIYMFLSGTRDVESQQKGVVTLTMPATNQLQSYSVLQKSQLKYMSLCLKTEAACPIKLCAFHYCMLDNDRRPLTRIERLIIKMTCAASSSMLTRIKFHIGTGEELQNILSSYGIPVNTFPATNTGAVKTVGFKKWLNLQRRIENLETADESGIPRIDCPGSKDVLFRSGSAMNSNPGNVMFRSLLESKILEVISSRNLPAKTKEDIAREIIQEISHRRKGRFLRWDNDNSCWMEFQDLTPVKTKIGIAYRDLKLKIMKSGATAKSQK